MNEGEWLLLEFKHSTVISQSGNGIELNKRGREKQKGGVRSQRLVPQKEKEKDSKRG